MNTKMSTQHTQGPLTVRGDLIFFASMAGGFSITNCPAPEANAARLAACWNACEPFEDPAEAIRLLQVEAAKAGALTIVDLPALGERDALRAENERLREALRACQRAACRGKSSAWKTALGDKIGAALGSKAAT